MIGLDTNVPVRHIMQDDAEQAALTCRGSGHYWQE
jgi:predicted nucleic-acid-binding protein